MQLPLLPDLPAGPDPWAELADAEGRGTLFLNLPVRTVLNSPASTRMPFWSINPYVGCEFGCTYCYARETHRWVSERMGASARGRLTNAAGDDANEAPNRLSAQAPKRLSAQVPPWLAFEKQILVKHDAPEVLATTFRPAEVKGRTIVIGTATDPYQPAERRFELTRRILERFLPYEGSRSGSSPSRRSSRGTQHSWRSCRRSIG